MKIKDVTDFLEAKCPIKLQENYDNCGLLVGSYDDPLYGVLTTLDITEKVIREAIEHNCNLIVAHHPIIFFGLKKLVNQNYVERCVMLAIANGINIYAIHTNLDNISDGVNKKICDILMLQNTEILHSKSSIEVNGKITGAGMIGTLPVPVQFSAFLDNLSKQFCCKIKYTGYVDEISTVAVCGGAGFYLLKYAVEKQADIFITSDITYHQYFDADNKIILADIGHFESEQFTKELLFMMLRPLLQDLLKEIKLKISEVNTNPIKYHG